MPDFNDLLAQAQKMQEKMKKVQESLRKIEVIGVSGADAVKVIMNGDGELKKIDFKESLLKEEKEIFEDLIVAAHNDAKAKLKKKHPRRYPKLLAEQICRQDLKFLFKKKYDNK